MDSSPSITTLTDIADVAATYGSLWISIIFAYLTVAYFVGRKLSRFLFFPVTTPYFLTASVFTAATIGHSHAFFLCLQDSEAIYDQVWIYNGNLDMWLTVAVIFFFGGTLLSLYFTYDVRHSRPKQ